MSVLQKKWSDFELKKYLNHCPLYRILFSDTYEQERLIAREHVQEMEKNLLIRMFHYIYILQAMSEFTLVGAYGSRLFNLKKKVNLVVFGSSNRPVKLVSPTYAQTLVN